MLSFKKQKGQGLTEFALILPLLLLLLLGIIEASRIIWAYVTVQTAAREAARYAITGRPYLSTTAADPFESQICAGTRPEPDPIVTLAAPWLCKPDPTGYHPRVGAIEQVAVQRGKTLAVSETCIGKDRYDACADTPGAFGVLIRGQRTIETDTGTTIVDPELQNDHPGQQGLVVEVNTYYNVEMLDPIFDALMGGQPIPLRGVVRMQNEGLDETGNVAAPPPVPPPPTPQGGSNPPGAGGVRGQIWSVSGYRVRQGDGLRVHLENHPPRTDDVGYDILLEGTTKNYLICQDVRPNVANKADATCELTEKPLANPVVNVPPGLYTLISTVAGTTGPIVARDVQQVEVVAGGSPSLVVEGGNVWAANSVTNLFLRFHPVGQTFTIKLFDAIGNEVAPPINNAQGNSPISWTVPDMVAKSRPRCDLRSKTPCTLISYLGGVEQASTQVYINQPEIVLSSGNGPYARGEQIYITLKDHTPGQRYNVKIPGATQSAILDSVNTNAAGNTTVPIVWTVPTGCGFGTGWPDGLYTFTSHPLGQPTEIARRPNVQFQTPASPFLSVEGGYTWSVGATINIRVHQHLSVTDHYLTFDGVRIPTPTSDDTFTTGTCGEAIVEFAIPFTTPAGNHTIRSYNKATNQLQAARIINVVSNPVILVQEGNTVLPNAKITIKLLNHQPNFNYKILYAGKVLFEQLTEPDGTMTEVVDLATVLPRLPVNPPPNLSDPANYGVPYKLESRAHNGNTTVAETELTLLVGDLAVVKVQAPPNVQSNTTVPVTITFRNNMPVTINRWVDLDLYLNPEPVAPSNLYGYNFPGDVKYWKQTIGPNETFTITHVISVPAAGSQALYGYIDTTNFVFENEKAGEVANTNNVSKTNFLVTCGGTAYIDTFSTNYAQGAVITGWQVARFGNSTQGYGTQVTGGKLYLNSSGSDNWVTSDSSGGSMYVYRSLAVPSASGMEVQVELSSLDLRDDWSRAGIEIRNSVSSNSSARVLLGVTRNNGSNSSTAPEAILAAYRDGGGMSWIEDASDASDFLNNHKVYLPSISPSRSGSHKVWLRIERVAGGGGVFNLYYNRLAKNSTSTPPNPDASAAAKASWWGSPVRSISVSGMGDNLYVGLFNVSWDSSTAGTSIFDNFGYWPNAANCANQQATPPPLPPGLEVCGETLSDRGFELNSISSPWKGINFRSTVRHSGTQSMKASSFDLGPQQPDFYQPFQLGDWVISTTSKLKLEFFKNIDHRGALQPEDKLYAIVTTSTNTAIGTALTDPVVVAHGGEGGSFDPSKWSQFASMALPLRPGINLENYKGKTLYLHFYNNSNGGSTPACSGGCMTDFYVDDVSLLSCTSQPMPATASTQIKGQLTINYSNGTFESLPYVKVWAYAVNGQVYETFTIQNGEFNFFNLPASAAGIEYTLFAQYHQVDPKDPTQIETLWADTTVILKSIHTSANPQIVFLDVYSLND